MRFFGGKKITGKVMRIAAVTLVLFFIALSLLLGITAYGAGNTAVSDNPSPSPSPAAAAEAITPAPPTPPPSVESLPPMPSPSPLPTYEVKDKYMIGDIAPLGDMLVQVTGFGALKGNKYEMPDSGNEFMIATVVIKNAGSADTEYSKYDFDMADGKGSAADHRMLLANKDTALSSGQLVPGGIVTGTLAFEEPKKASGLSLIYAPSGLGGKSAIFDMSGSLKDFETLQKGDICVTGDTNTIGCAACSGSAAVTVESFEKSVGVYDKPKNGYEYITVAVKIENTGDSDLNCNPYYFTMMNSFGEITDAVITSVDSGTALSAGIIAPGGTVEGTIVYEESAGDTGLKLLYYAAAGESRLVFPMEDQAGQS